MQIICISRGSYGYSIEVVEKLSEKTGYTAISRETITDKATEFGIPVGKLEMMILKNRPLTDEMSNVVDMSKAFATAYVCEKVLNENIIYHGRTGHLVLPGLSNVLRIRAIAEPEYRINQVMQRLRLDREKAKKYIEQVDEDIKKWTHALYNTAWDDSSRYDITVNAAHLSAESVASALVHLAQMPEFQATPASQQTLQDLLLAAKCRLAVGSDDRTRDINVRIHADKGNVAVTYMPRQSKEAKAIPDVLKSVEGIQSLVCTVATTNILFLGEKFNPNEEYFTNLIEISNKWNAAIELVRIAGEDEESAYESSASQQVSIIGTANESGGILEDSDEQDLQRDDGFGVYETVDRLIQSGHAGGYRTIYGGIDGFLKGLSETENYSLVAIGDMFSSKGAAKQRLKRDLLSKLKDKFRVPVIGTEDLKAKYLFGPRQCLNMIGLGALSALLYIVVFSFQEPLLIFVSKGHFGGGFSEKLAAALGVTAAIPFVAYIIGSFYSNLLKLLKIE
jgi:cytidylate kinase